MNVTASESIPSRWAALGELQAALARGAPCLQADGLWGSARALVAASLVSETGRPALLLAPGTVERHRMAEDARFFLESFEGAGAAPVLEFPPAEPASWRGRHRDHAAERARAAAGRIRAGEVRHDPRFPDGCPPWCDVWPMCRVAKA